MTKSPKAEVYQRPEPQGRHVSRLCSMLSKVMSGMQKQARVLGMCKLVLPSDSLAILPMHAARIFRNQNRRLA